MKKHFSKVTKHLLFLAFAIFVISAGFGTTSHAATQKVENLKQIDSHEKGVRVSWDSGLSGVDKYIMYLSVDKTFPENNTVKANGYVSSNNNWFFGLNPNSTYYVKVTAQNSSGNVIAVSDVITCITKPDSVQKIAHSKSTTSSVTVVWEAPFSGAEYYKVYYKPENSSVNPIYVGTTTGKSYTISGLKDDTEYRTYVYAAKKSVSGYEAISGDKYSAYDSTIAEASKFSNIKLDKWEAGSSKAIITLQRKASDRQDGIEMEIRSLSGKKITTIKDSIYTTQITVSNSKIKNKGFKYRLRYYVTTDTQTCYGPYTKEKIVVAQPKVTAKKKSNSSVKLKWKKISGAKSYSVYLRKESGFKKVATVTSANYVLKKLKPRTNYQVYIKANGVKSGKKKYSSTKPINQSVTEIWYSDKNSYISNYHRTITN